MAAQGVNQIFCKDSTFFTTKSGEVYDCGRNDYGQLGNETTDNVLEFERNVLKNVDKFFLGDLHTFALYGSGNVVATGNNEYGQLGIGTSYNVSKFSTVSIGHIKKIAFAGCHSIFQSVDGVIIVSGSSPDTDIIRIYPEMVQDLAEILIDDYDSLVRWDPDGDKKPIMLGKNAYGELATGNTDEVVEEEEMYHYDMGDLKQVVAGGEHLIFLNKDGGVFTCGSNDHYQLGYHTPQSYLASPSALPLTNITSVCAGYEHSLFLDENNKLWACGSNKFGQLGRSKDVKYLVDPEIIADDIMYIAAGDHYTYAVKLDGTIWVTGDNRYGQLGLGDTESRYHFEKLHGYFFDTEIKYALELPDSISTTYTKGNISHRITVTYEDKGHGNVYTWCDIYTPSIDKTVRIEQYFLNKFNTSNLNVINDILKENAETLIREAKTFITTTTVFYRIPIYAYKTEITLSNGEVIYVDGELNEEQAKEAAFSYIAKKYDISETIEYYDQTEFTEEKIHVEGELGWAPTRGTKSYVIKEDMPSFYNS